MGAINQGHIFQFLKKPWQPEDLENAVRLAGHEYERLVQEDQDVARLKAEIMHLQQRVATLESEVSRLQSGKA